MSELLLNRRRWRLHVSVSPLSMSLRSAEPIRSGLRHLNVMRRSWPSIVLAALILQIPFEFSRELFGLSNLQWTFVALVAVSAPLLIENWRWLTSYRAVQAAF